MPAWVDLLWLTAVGGLSAKRGWRPGCGRWNRDAAAAGGARTVLLVPTAACGHRRGESSCSATPGSLQPRVGDRSRYGHNPHRAGLGGPALTFRDVRVAAETRASGGTDELTGLANRRLLIEELATGCGCADAGGDRRAPS